MKRLDLPANITLMELTPQRLQSLRPVRVLDIYDTAPNFHPDGLFSTEIFGRVGSEMRDERFSYIDLRASVLHPVIFQHLCKLKGLYGGILSGKAFAIWNPVEKDFEASDALNGESGYAFFMSHYKELIFKPTGSDARDVRIQLIQKFKDRALTSKVLVIPAGLRDIEVDVTGREKEGEINGFYRSLISTSNAIGITSDLNSPILNNSRYSMQLAFNNIYDYLHNLIQGKSGFIQGKWGARRIFNGTRNVISAMDTSVAVMGAKNSPTSTQSSVGLFQTIKGVLPLTKHLLLTGWLRRVFQTEDGMVTLVNPATLQPESFRISPTVTDRWFTSSGLESVINSYSAASVRLKPVMIENYYVGLVYRPKDRMVFKFFNDIRELPEGALRSDVHPISLCELIYIAGYMKWNELAMFVTRYPITGLGSIYPSLPYVKNTVVSEVRRELDETWKEYPEEFTALEYPTFEREVFIDTLIPHPRHLEAMGGD